jgi:hypothetical protein
MNRSTRQENLVTFLFFAFLPFCLSVFLSFCLSVFLSFCLSVFLPFCLSVSLSLCFSISIFVLCKICFYLHSQIGGRDFDVVLKSGRPGRFQIGIGHRPESLQSDLRRIGPFSSNESGKDFVLGAKVNLVSSSFIIMNKSVLFSCKTFRLFRLDIYS